MQYLKAVTGHFSPTRQLIDYCPVTIRSYICCLPTSAFECQDKWGTETTEMSFPLPFLHVQCETF